MTLRERLDATVALAHRRFQTDAFETFCARYLGDLEEVTRDFFRSEQGRDAVRQKVAALYPAHEVEEFTDRFWQRIQRWRRDEGAIAGSGA